MDIIHGEELAKRYEEFIERAAADERIIISHAGKQVALVSFDDLMFLEDVDHQLDERDSEEVRRRMADNGQNPSPFVPSTLASQSSKK